MCRSLAFALLLVVASCAAPPPREPVAPASVSSATLDPSSSVSVYLEGASRVRYQPSTLSARRSPLRVIVINHMSVPLDVSSLKTHLSVTRDGVAFPCPAEDERAASQRREPTSIDPKQSATFERTVDCPLPMMGHYHIDVAVSFGREGHWATPRPIRTLSMRVSASPDVAPRALDAAPGLWGAIGAANLVAGSSSAAKGKIVLSIVNGSAQDVAVPRMRLGLQVFRGSGTIPCEDEPIPLNTPALLKPGQSHSEPLEVSCLGLSTPGRYEVRGRLIPEGAAPEREQPIGRLSIEISADPTRIVPP